MTPDRETYHTLARSHDVVPVYLELLADRETPVSVLQRFVNDENVFLLESMEGGEKWGRYSFIGVGPTLELNVAHTGVPTGAFEKLRSVFKDLRVANTPGLPPFIGGLVGFLGYESMGDIERMPTPKLSHEGITPCSQFLRADRVIVFDNVRHTVKIVVCTRPQDAASIDAAYATAESDIRALAERLEQPVAVPTRYYAPVTFGSNLSRPEFEAMVSRARKYIHAGDAFQVVLSQRFSATTDVPPLQVYRALRLLNPSPYTFFLKIGERTLVGSSPEVMVRLTGRRIELRPIAGTRPRGRDEQDDARLAAELKADQKECAEHVMLIDLGRNDVGRVAEPGSVEVTDYMVIERYSHVMHIVSHVQGRLREGLDACDVIRATFPAGTLTGAPKIRAMEIIHELEPGPRGVYGGAVGYISYGGNMDLAITIRTVELIRGQARVQAGAGIVYDSDAGKEFEETCHKARGIQKAVQMAAAGLSVELMGGR